MVETKHDYYRDNIPSKDYILCKESAAEFLNLSNGNLDLTIRYYTNSDRIEYVEHYGLRCTSVNQTINDLSSDENSDIQVLLESLSNYYYKNGESFEGLRLYSDSIRKQFEKYKNDAIHYYDED